jgi:hypothetical protein
MPEKEPSKDMCRSITLHDPAEIGGIQDQGAEREIKPRQPEQATDQPAETRGY